MKNLNTYLGSDYSHAHSISQWYGQLDRLPKLPNNESLVRKFRFMRKLDISLYEVEDVVEESDEDRVAKIMSSSTSNFSRKLQKVLL